MYNYLNSARSGQLEHLRLVPPVFFQQGEATRGSSLHLTNLTGMKPSPPAHPLASSQPLTDSTRQEPESLYSRSVLYH